MKRTALGMLGSVALAGGAYYLARSVEPVPPAPCNLVAEPGGATRIDTSWTSAPVGEVQGVRWTTKTDLVWTRDQNVQAFDVLVGDIAELPVGGKPHEACLASNIGQAGPKTLAGGAGQYFLVRARNLCGAGTWGAATSGERVPMACGP